MFVRGPETRARLLTLEGSRLAIWEYASLNIPPRDFLVLLCKVTTMRNDSWERKPYILLLVALGATLMFSLEATGMAEGELNMAWIIAI